MSFPPDPSPAERASSTLGGLHERLATGDQFGALPGQQTADAYELQPEVIETAAPVRRSLWQRLAKGFLANPASIAGTVLLIGFAVVAVAAPVFAPCPESQVRLLRARSVSRAALWLLQRQAGAAQRRAPVRPESTAVRHLLRRRVGHAHGVQGRASSSWAWLCSWASPWARSRATTAAGSTRCSCASWRSSWPSRSCWPPSPWPPSCAPIPPSAAASSPAWWPSSPSAGWATPV